MDIKKWKVMLAVDHHGSFTRAGLELGYTQSGITQMMKTLEKDVGFSLFKKVGHGTFLTDEAKALLPAIRSLLHAEEVIRQEIASLKGAQTGTIIIGTYLSCSIHWIPKIIQEFQQKHPDIHFKIIQGSEGELAEWIQERKVDIGFLSYQSEQRYQFLPVMNDELFAVLPKGHPLAAQDAIPIEDFNDQPFIITEYTPGSDIHRILKEHQVTPDIRYVTVNEFSSLSMVEHNLGLAILPRLLLRGQIGNYTTLPPPPARLSETGTCLLLSGRTVTSFQRLFGICKSFSSLSHNLL